jgi:hypothetical protein
MFPGLLLDDVPTKIGDTNPNSRRGVVQIVASPGQAPGGAPIPGSLPLMATGTLGGMLAVVSANEAPSWGH